VSQERSPSRSFPPKTALRFDSKEDKVFSAFWLRGKEDDFARAEVGRQRIKGGKENGTKRKRRTRVRHRGRRRLPFRIKLQLSQLSAEEAIRGPN